MKFKLFKNSNDRLHSPSESPCEMAFQDKNDCYYVEIADLQDLQALANQLKTYMISVSFDGNYICYE